MRFFHDDIGFLKSIKRETTTLQTNYQPITNHRPHIVYSVGQLNLEVIQTAILIQLLGNSSHQILLIL